MDEAYTNLKDYGEAVVESLIWGLQQDDVDLKLLVLQLLQRFYADTKRALPAVRALISDDEDRLIRCTAINTAGIMADTHEDLFPLLTPRLESEDDFERLVSAGNLWRISRSEDAYVVLRRALASGEEEPMAMMARGYFEEGETNR